MATKDHEIFYVALGDPSCVVPTPNTVSRGLKTGERSFATVVWQAGKAILDSELMLGQDSKEWSNYLLQRWQVQSGWLRGQTHHDVTLDYVTETNTPGINDDSGGTYITGGGTLVNSFILPKLEATVGGWPVVVEYTNTRDAGWNLVTLSEPTVYTGALGTIQRTDFVFLEVWPSLVPPSPRANGYVQVLDPLAIAPGDTIVFNADPALTLTAIAVGPPVGNQFVIGATPANTATNIAVAITAMALSPVYATAVSNFVHIHAIAPGVIGNAILLAVTGVGMLASGPALSGGADRPNKPATSQGDIFRHGNILSPSQTWLPDEIMDVVVSAETSQRIQIQYRVRATGDNEAVNFKTHPEGFGTPIGAPPTGGIFAQGPRATPAFLVGGARTYPFVPADGVSTWLDTDASAYGMVDSGLWIAGDGTAQSAQDLGSADGFIYAIPICFVHRHNDAITGATKGFLSLNNANGAPLWDHAGYDNAEWPPAPGLAVGAGLSDRPDGHFADVITLDNVLDLRRHVIFHGVDMASEAKYQIQSLLDGSIRTWSIDTASKQELGNGSGDMSVHYLVCNEVGRSAAHGGLGPTTRGEFIREFDHIARRFGDQSVVERVVISFYPGDRAVGPVIAPGTVNPGKYVTKAGGVPFAALWYEGDVLHLDLDQLDPSTLGTFFQGLDGGGTSYAGGPVVTDYMPPGTCITDVLSAYHDDGNYNVAVDQRTQFTLIKGLGTRHLELTLDANTTQVTGGLNVAAVEVVGDGGGSTGTARRIFLEVEITYPIGVGTTDTVYHPLTPDATQYNGSAGMGPGPMLEEFIGATPPTDLRPNDCYTPLAPQFREGYREVMLEYVANNTLAHRPAAPDTDPVEDTLISRNTTDLYFPRRVYYDRSTAVDDIPAAAAMIVDSAVTEWSSSSRKVVLTAPLSGAGQTLCDIKYYAQDPVPNYGDLNLNYQLAVYFRSNSPQTAGIMEGAVAGWSLPITLQVEPLFFGETWTGQIGAGSTDRAFPYGSFSDTLPINDIGMAATREWYFCATANISVDDFDASTGLLNLHSFVQADVQNILEFGGPGVGEVPRADNEFRAYYPFADDTAYRPTILSQPLSGAARHKVFVPFLARATEDSKSPPDGILFRKDELLLIVLCRFAELDDENNVRFTDSNNRTCAALYRTRNLLLLASGQSPTVFVPPPIVGP